MGNKIFDCTTFYNANMLFNLRYHSLKNHVDYFVVCEANKTHTGQYKGYNFDKKFLSKYGEKIIKSSSLALTIPLNKFSI